MATRKKIKATKKVTTKAKKSSLKGAAKKPAAKKAKVKVKPAAKKTATKPKAAKLRGSAWRTKARIKSKKVLVDKAPLPTLEDGDATAAEITRRLREALSPAHISIENLSGRHAGHAESKKHGGGHYKVSLVSDLFEGLTRLHREKWVTTLLADLLNEKKIHAISLSLSATNEVKGIYGL